jgi:hypothetical protein
MEPTQKEKELAKKEHQDVDLGTLLYQSGQAFKNLFNFIGQFFKATFQTTLLGLLFVRRNLLWLLLGAVIGLGYGLYGNLKTGFRYYSSSTVKMNFGGTRALYNTIDYLNSLKDMRNTNELSKIFGISAADALAISSFEATPVMTDLIVADMYREGFMKVNRGSAIRQDTFWTRVMRFETFKKNLTKYDYPIHEIKAICTNPVVFAKLEEGLTKLIEQNETLKRNREFALQSLNKENRLLENSLNDLDTLSKAYNSKILREGATREAVGVTNMTLLDKSMAKAPELDLYETKLTLRDELNMVQNKLANDQDIMQVYSAFSPMGQRQGVYNQGYFKSALNGLILAFGILLLIELFRFLGKLNPKDLMKQQ